jgi:hypothetical protein
LKGIYAATYRAAAGTIHDVKVQDRGGTIAGPHYGINFSVAEMLPEYLGITSAKAAARRAGSVASPRKASAAKINGAQGGRPRRPPRTD